MLPMPTTVSTSSGICPQPMEPEVSISSMMLGLTWAELVEVKGELEMSVWADRAGVAGSDRAMHSASARALRAAIVGVCLVMSLLLGGYEVTSPSPGCS